MIPRVPGWEQRLFETIAAREKQPFTFGENDCGHFAAACVEAIGGVDVLGTLKGSYRGRLGMVARLRFRGHRTASDACSALLEPFGALKIDPRASRVGDLGVTADDVICVRVPAGFIALREGGGLGAAEAVEAWAIWSN